MPSGTGWIDGTGGVTRMRNYRDSPAERSRCKQGVLPDATPVDIAHDVVTRVRSFPPLPASRTPPPGGYRCVAQSHWLSAFAFSRSRAE